MLALINRAAATGCLLLAGWAMSGCATAPADPGVWVASTPGTVTTFSRRASGSLGSGDVQVVWTIGPERTWNGRQVVPHASPQAGTSLYDATTRAYVAQLNPAGQPVVSFEPPIALPSPLVVGSAWRSKHTMTVHARQAKLPYEVAFKVEAFEDVSVPAGNFKAFRVVATNSFGEVDTRWWAPAQNSLLVKRTVQRPASYPQGAGQLEAQLLSKTTPKQ
ncbi:MAG: hypothetical protein U5L05_00695 [Rubrivivax sp.]|nr:hypothetical protein [Rubrivivax sp.]